LLNYLKAKKVCLLQSRIYPIIPKHYNFLKVSWINGILLRNNKLIIDLFSLRDKNYAHTDDSTNDKNIDITFKQVEDLLDIADDILKSVYKELFEIDLITPPLRFNRNKFNLLRLLVNAENQRQSEFVTSGWVTLNSLITYI
jgi:hypothetical protein